MSGPGEGFGLEPTPHPLTPVLQMFVYPWSPHSTI